jgi:hypothetical protein
MRSYKNSSKGFLLMILWYDITRYARWPLQKKLTL